MALSDWDITKKVTITIPQQTEALEDFPLLVNLSQASGNSDFDCTAIFNELTPSSLENVDYDNGQPWCQQYYSNIIQSTDITGWTTGTNVINSFEASHVLVTNSRVHLIGGYAGGSRSEVSSAPINSDGTLGTWVSGTSLPVATAAAGLIATKNRVYLCGGSQSNVYSATVYTAPINSDGTLGAWTTGTSLPGATGYSVPVVTKNRAYLCGGFNGSNTSAVYTAPINSDGTLGTWTTSTSLPGVLGFSFPVITKSRIYLCGGCSSAVTSTNTVYTAPINSDGTLGTWATEANFPINFAYGSAVVTKNRAYLLGGRAPSATTTVYTAPVNTDGTLGTWVTGTSLPGPLYSSVTVVTSSKVYMLGGNNGSSGVGTVYVANFSGGVNDYSKKSYTTLTPSDDPYWDQTVLAMPMSGTNSSTNFVDLKGKVITAAGNAQISTSQYKFGNSSAYFDGTGDYLVLPLSTYNPGANDFTLESWVYPLNSNKFVLLAGQGDQATVAGSSYVFYVNGTGGCDLYMGGSGYGMSPPPTAPINQWTHIVFTRYGNTFNCFVNGVLYQSVACAGTVNVGATNYAASIGAMVYNGGTVPLNGYIDSLRFTIGIARYTSSFTPPTQSFQYNDLVPPKKLAVEYNNTGKQCFIEIERWDSIKRHAQLWVNTQNLSTTSDTLLTLYYDNTHSDNTYIKERYWDNVVLALPMNGTNGSTVFNDLKGKTVTATGAAQISTTQSKFGGSSAYFDGNGDYLTIPYSSDVNLSSGDWTIEVWVMCNALAANDQNILNKDAVANTSYPQYNLQITTAGNLVSSLGNGNGLVPTQTTYGNVPFSLSTWHHIALVRKGSIYTGYLDGSTAWSQTIITAMVDGGKPLLIGYQTGHPLVSCFNGYIDDLRITKGVARYVDNFTPPTRSVFQVQDVCDDFTGTDGDLPRKDLWNPNTSTGMIIASNKLRFTSNSSNTLARCDFKLIVSGDFDIQFDFNLITYPNSSSWEFDFMIYQVGSTTQDRVHLCISSLGSGYFYQNGRVINSTYTIIQGPNATTDTFGKMRIIRQGSLVSFFVWDNVSAWTARSSYSWNTLDMIISPQLSAWGGNPTVVVDIDNFVVNYATSVSGYVGDIGSYPARDVWNPDYSAVYHLSQDPSTTVKDSTSNARNLTPYGSMTAAQLVDGPTGKALNFDGVNDIMSSASTNLSALQTAFTFEGVSKLTESSEAWGRVLQIGPNTTGFLSVNQFNLTGFMDVSVIGDSVQSGVSLDSSVFKHYGVVLASGTVRAIGNGSIDSVTNTVSVTSLNNTNIYLGADGSGGTYTGQQLRSIRISQIARSAAWIATSYNSDFDQLVNFSVYQIYVSTSYPKDYTKMYGTNQLLQLTATVSGSSDTYYYNTTFYTTSGIALAPTVSGIATGSTVTALIPTVSGIDYFWYASISVPSIALNYTTPEYSFYVRYMCSGTCNNIDQPVSGVVINLHRRQNGQLVGTTTTAGTGTFVIDSQYNEAHYVVALHPDETKNALVYDKIIP